MSRPLKLRAEDAEDLEVIAACLQEALVHVGEMTYLPRRRRFVVALNRFVWEGRGAADGDARRVRCGVHIDGVLAVRTRGFDLGDRQRLLELLTVQATSGEDGAATISLIFSGGASIALEVECIECSLTDLDEPWRALRRPEHPVDDGA